MFHLPKHGERVKVWPAPKMKVADQAPADAGHATSWLPPHGKIVTWDAGRYAQYLRGELHFHDPRPEKCPTRKNDPADKELHPDGEACVHEAHADEHLSPELKAELKRLALEEGEGRLYKEAKKEAAEAAPPKPPEPEQGSTPTPVPPPGDDAGSDR